MKISIMVYSRNNPENITNTILSIINNFSGENELEILLALDDDDNTRFQVIENFIEHKCVIIYILPRVGYFKLSKFTNFLGKQATGNLIWLLSDKTIVNTKDWDTILNKYENKFIVCGCKTTWINDDGSISIREDMLFPIISKQWYNVLEKICDQVHVDSCISCTMRNLLSFGDAATNIFNKVCFNITDIHVEHDRRKGGNVEKPGESDFFFDESIRTRLIDARKIYDYLENNMSVII